MHEYKYGVATISRLLKIIVSFAEYNLFYRALSQKKPMILRSLLIVATPQDQDMAGYCGVVRCSVLQRFAVCCRVSMQVRLMHV